MAIIISVRAKQTGRPGEDWEWHPEMKCYTREQVQCSHTQCPPYIWGRAHEEGKMGEN